MKKTVYVAIAAALCLLAGCKEKELTEYEKGMEKLEQQKYEKAVGHFENAIEKGDSTELAWRGIGIARTEQGAYEKAEEAFTTALEVSEKKQKALKRDLSLYLADVQYRQEDYSSCIETCDKLLETGKTEDAYFLRGSAYLQRSEYKKAEKDFQKVLSNSKDYQDYLDIYLVYQACDLNADGAEYLEDGLKLKGSSPEDFYQRGRIYYYLSEYKNAEKEMKKAREKGYDQATVYLGKIYAENQEFDKAMTMYEECLEIEGLEAEGYNGLAVCAATEGDYEKALSYVEKGLKQDDWEMNQILLFNQIVFYEKSMNYGSAKEKVTAYLEMYPGDKDAVREGYFLETR